MGYKILSEEKKEQKRTAQFIEDGNFIQPIQESSEIAETIKELNDDTFHEGFSNIDMKTRLHSVEISSIIALDSLVSFGFLPISTGTITRAKKRLAVSLNGLGRAEIVKIANGLDEGSRQSSMFEKLGGMFGGRKWIFQKFYQNLKEWIIDLE